MAAGVPFIESPEFALVCWVIRPTRTDIECLVDWHICFLPMSALLDPPIVEVTCWLPALISGFRFVLSILASVTPSALKYLFHYSRAYQPTHQPTSDKHFALYAFLFRLVKKTKMLTLLGARLPQAPLSFTALKSRSILKQFMTLGR